MKKKKKKLKKKRSCQTHLWLGRREEQGLYDNLMRELETEDIKEFRWFMRINPAIFRNMVDELRPFLEKQTTVMRQPHPVGLKVAITLRYYASGHTHRDLQSQFRVAHNTMSGPTGIISEVTEAIIHRYVQYVK